MAPGLLNTARALDAMKIETRHAVDPNRSGFSLVEVVIAIAIVSLSFGGVIYGYVLITDKAEWTSYSLAAQSLAMQEVELARGAKWDPNAWPPVDEFPPTNFSRSQTLDLPVAGQPVYATDYVSITTVSTVPPLRQLQADCVWTLPSRGASIRGPFTNTVITLRTADQ